MYYFLRNTDTCTTLRVAYPIRLGYGYASDTYPERISKKRKKNPFRYLSDTAHPAH
uniref:Uncharacterized protein n=1 Tax=Arundo donax TaxID=35708 RepID=A0A0A9BYV8_ARUDO